MDALYRDLVPSGGLAFDIGAHVGDRVASFRRLGARVVAVEPQPGPLRALRLIHGRDPSVTVVPAAVGAAPGRETLHLNAANPTVATASRAFIAAAAGAEGWSQERWDSVIEVDCVTLDGLIARHGRPDFVKIDVEGWEDAVLSGLSRPVPALSFEVTALGRQVARDCVDLVAALGPYRFNFAHGESQRLVVDAWLGAHDMALQIDDLPAEFNSGDVYARLEV